MTSAEGESLVCGGGGAGGVPQTFFSNLGAPQHYFQHLS